MGLTTHARLTLHTSSHMPPPPPLDEVLLALRDVMLPAAGVAAFVVAAVLLLGRWAAHLATALGMLAGLAFVNWSKSFLPWSPEKTGWEYFFQVAWFVSLAGVVLTSLESLFEKYGHEKWHLRVEILAWLVRVGVVFVACRWCLPSALVSEKSWLLPTIVSVVVVQWHIVDRLMRRGQSGELLFLFSAIYTLGGGVLLYGHSARFMDIAAVIGLSSFGVAVVVQATNIEARGAAPLLVMLLAPLWQAGHYANSMDDIPYHAYALVALAPLGLLLWWPEFFDHRAKWLSRVLRSVVVIGLVLAGLIIAGQHGQLPWEETW
jgi:hypothetical protein